MEPTRVIVGDAKSTEGKIWHVLIPRKGELLPFQLWAI